MSLGGGEVPSELRGRDLRPVLRGDSDSVQDAVHFTYDDHQAGTAMQDAPGQPNRIRACARATRSTPSTTTRAAERPPEYELYDLTGDPLEVENLLNVRTGEARTAKARALKDEMSERLRITMSERGTTPPAPAVLAA